MANGILSMGVSLKASTTAISAMALARWLFLIASRDNSQITCGPEREHSTSPTRHYNSKAIINAEKNRATANSFLKMAIAMKAILSMMKYRARESLSIRMAANGRECGPKANRTETESLLTLMEPKSSNFGPMEFCKKPLLLNKKIKKISLFLVAMNKIRLLMNPNSQQSSQNKQNNRRNSKLKRMKKWKKKRRVVISFEKKN